MSDNKIKIQKFPFSEAQFKQRLKADTTFKYTPEEELEMCKTILGCIGRFGHERESLQVV